jgi:glutamine cyclotransferase
VLANVYQTIGCRIDLQTDWSPWIDLTACCRRRRRATDVLNGIAYDPTGDRLFVTGKLWPRLFEIRLERQLR